MANFQHLKASRTRVLDRFPTKEFGNDGDIVISRISGRGVFICSKAGGMWYVANQMQELSRIGKATLKDVTTNKLTVKNIANTEKPIDRYIVSDSGNIQYKTGKQVANDLPLAVNNIDYKAAYCSLERYTDQETCEANGGTWYYSTNNTHDSISNTAENQLLTIGQMHNNLDAEPTLLYDGSVLEIKRNTNFDENWYTSAQSNLLKLSYNSENSSYIGVNSVGDMNFVLNKEDASFNFLEDGAKRLSINTADGLLKLHVPVSTGSGLLDYFSIDIDDNAVTTIKTNDNDGTAGNLILDIDGDIELNADGGDITFKDDSASLATINGDGLTINNIGSDSAGDNYLVEVSGLVKKRTPAEVLSDIGAQASLTFGISDTNVTKCGAGIVDDDFIRVNGTTFEGRSASEVRSDIGAGTSSVDALNDLSDVSYSSGDLTISSLDTIVAAGDLTLDAAGDIKLDAAGDNIDFLDNGTLYAGIQSTAGKSTFVLYESAGSSTDDFFSIVTAGNGQTAISTTDGNAEAAHLTIDVDGDFRLDSNTGNFVTKNNGTEFSVANSAYAGMILGYRMIGEDATHASYTLTTSYAVPNSAMTVRFVAPPSGAVEIMIQVYANASTSNRFLYFGLSDNATYNTIGATYEQLHRMPDETDDSIVQHYWTVTGLTAGTTYNYWLGAKTSGTTAYLGWGGTLSGRFCDFIMKATALPAATSDFAEYD